MQVSRLGQPLVNEVVIPRALKDAFNAIPPTEDAVALPVVLDPEVPKLLKLSSTSIHRRRHDSDLVTIFLTGIPGLNQRPGATPSEMLRLNVGIPPSPAPNPLGVLGGDGAGYPQRTPRWRRRDRHRDPRDGGRDAADAEFQHRDQRNSWATASMGNDVPYLTVFPYLGLPHPGNR